MYNWFLDENEVVQKTINAIMDELEILIDTSENNMTANYWIDGTHNVFAFINGNGKNRYIEIHYELYGFDDEIIGDLIVSSTQDTTKNELMKEIIAIVNHYYKS